MDLRQSANTALVHCLGIKPNENILIVTDSHLKNLGEIFYLEARALGSEATIIEMAPRNNNGEEPPKPVAGAMALADVILLITRKSLSHTQARKFANERGARVASLPGLTGDMMARTLNADYPFIKELSEKYAEALDVGSLVKLSSPNGTQLSFSIAGRTACPDIGMLKDKGVFGNLPAGEAYIAPVEGTANGKLVIDGSMAGIGRIENPINIKVVDGYAVEVTGGLEADKLNEILEKYGKDSRNIAELGIGTNPRAKLTGLILEDEKVLGTIHVALGDNSTIGGVVSVPSHLDGVILKPTLVIDGKEIIFDGKLLL